MSAVLRLALPLTLWIAGFSAVYGLQGLLCARLAPWIGASGDRALLIAAALAVIAAQILLCLALRRWPARDPALRRISLGLSVVALVATVWTLLPPLMLSHCL